MRLALNNRLRSPPTTRERGWAGRAGLEPGALAWAALAVLMAGMAAFLYHEMRSTTLYADEWQWAFLRGRASALEADLFGIHQDSELDAFLQPHNQHLSLVPVAIYKLLFATAGLDDYVPYRVMVIGAHLVCVALVFVYARRRVGPFLGVLAAALLLFLGPAWENVLWPFQVAWLISLAAGVGALLLLDRRDGVGDGAACGLLALSLASSGLGVPIALGAAVDVLWGRRGWRDAWIVAAPLALYGVWWLIYQDPAHSGTVRDLPQFVLDAAGSALAALLGLSGKRLPHDDGTLVDRGRPLFILAAVLVAWRLVRLGRVPPRVLALASVPVSFWALTELSRGGFTQPYLSRYLYVGGMFTILVAVELARGVSVRWPVAVLLAAVVAASAISNLGPYRDGARYYREQAQFVRADMGALEIARPVVDDNFRPREFPGLLLPVLLASDYFSVTREEGTPAMTIRELVGAPGPVRSHADENILIPAHEIGLEPASAATPLGARPVVENARGAVDSGPCVVFRPRSTPARGRDFVQVELPPGGLLLRAQGGPARVGVRRFGDVFERLGRVRPSAPALLRIAPDRARVPWHVEVLPTAGASVCGLPDRAGR